MGADISRRSLLQHTAALAVGGGMLSACGTRENDGSSSRAVTFLNVLPLTSLTFAPELLADAAGYFADHGLDVGFQSTRGTAQATALVLAGSAPLTRIGQIEAVSHASNRGAPILNIGTIVKESTIRFVSSASVPVREPRDFVGKTIGIPSEGGESETTLDLVLASAGIDPMRVERQVVGVGPGVFNLVEQGRIAGFSVSIDTAKILERQMSGVIVLRPGEFMTAGAQLYMTTAETLDQNRDVLRRYLAAIREALDFMINDEGFDETLRIMRQKYSFGTLLDTEIAKDSLSEYVRVWTSEGVDNILRTDPDRWRSGYEELVRSGQAQAGKDPAEWFTNALLPA
jgi:ABC-type nitrate/sulfonate/bicarbonate transport system substrate-binding protein